MGIKDCMIHSSRFCGTDMEVLKKMFELNGIIGVYHKGQKDMFDFIRCKLDILSYEDFIKMFHEENLEDLINSIDNN